MGNHRGEFNRKPDPDIRKTTATAYQPLKGQTDGSPNKTASGKRIDLKDPKKHKWIAVSRDLFRSGLSFGTRVLVSGTPHDGIWEVQDLMNKRHKNKIDLLVGRKDVVGLWRNARIHIIE